MQSPQASKHANLRERLESRADKPFAATGAARWKYVHASDADKCLRILWPMQGLAMASCTMHLVRYGTCAG